MAKRKFNLKTYVKISGDDHIEKRLRDEHEEAPNEINEKQLENYRTTEPDVLTEKQLEKQRGGNKESDELPEKRLDTDKAKFANNYRNPSAYKGDISKLEEKRLASDPVEKEKYKDASVTAPKLRWWEKTDDPMGMKLARGKRWHKKAQFGEEEDWGNDEEEDVLDLIDDYSLSPAEEHSLIAPEEETESLPPFKEVSQGSDESTGTPTYWGRIQVSLDIDERNRDMIMQDIADFIDVNHPELSNMKKRLDVSQIDSGIIEYTATPEFEVAASNDFPIIVARDVKKN